MGLAVCVFCSSSDGIPQRYIERLPEQLPCEADHADITIEPLRLPQQPTVYNQDDLFVRQFTKDSSRRLIRRLRTAVPREAVW